MFLFLFFSFHLIIGGPISLDGIIPLFFALDLSISLDGIIPLFFSLDLPILDGIKLLLFSTDFGRHKIYFPFLT